jgi:hypothetical protein
VRKIVAMVAAGLALGLTACSSPPTSGTVYLRPYSPPGFWYSTRCAMHNTVTKSRMVKTYDARGRVNGYRSESYSESTCIMWVQDAHPTAPNWSICLQADDDPKRKGCFNVPESTWQRYEIGAHYPDPR